MSTRSHRFAERHSGLDPLNVKLPSSKARPRAAELRDDPDASSESILEAIQAAGTTSSKTERQVVVSGLLSPEVSAGRDFFLEVAAQIGYNNRWRSLRWM